MRFLCGFLLVSYFGLADIGGARAEGSMNFRLASNGGNCYDTCEWIAAEGVITRDTLQTFEEFIRDGAPKLIYFHSTGGDLFTALEFGRRLRELEYSTSVGKTRQSQYSDAQEVVAGQCLSACAYLFLGGVSRSVFGLGLSSYNTGGSDNSDDHALGFHSLTFDGNLEGMFAEDLLDNPELLGPGSRRVFGVAELANGAIVGYLNEMGVSASLWQRAIEEGPSGSSLDFKYPSNEELMNFGVVSFQATAFGPFTLQIHGAGLVATARRERLGLDQSGIALLRLLRLCEAPTPWLVYTQIGQATQEDFAETAVVMEQPRHNVLSIEVGQDTNLDRDAVPEIYLEFAQSMGARFTSRGDLSMPVFNTDNSRTVFFPLSRQWQKMIADGRTINWMLWPRASGWFHLRHTFSSADTKVATVVNDACIKGSELAGVRF